jgi:hypothetical protein
VISASRFGGRVYPDEPVHRRLRYAAPVMTTTGELSGFLAARRAKKVAFLTIVVD